MGAAVACPECKQSMSFVVQYYNPPVRLCSKMTFIVLNLGRAFPSF